MDVHKDMCRVVCIDEKGKIIEKYGIETSTKGLDEFSWKIPDNAKIALEASTSGKFVYKHLKKEGLDILMAHPRSLRLIAESKDKNDDKDALILAQMLRMNSLKESYVPSEEIESVRQLIRHRVNLGRKSALVKNQIHAILAENGVKYGSGGLFGKQGLIFLDKLELSDSSKSILESYLRELGYYKDEIELSNTRLAKIAKGDEDVELLMTIPGIDYYSALAIISEIGDISRFPNANKLARYSGLTPGIRQTGKSIHYGRMTKEGPAILRQILTLNARSAINVKGGKLNRQYTRLSKRIGGRKAIVAMARKLLIIIYHMLMERKPYEDRNDDLTYRKIARMRQRLNAVVKPEAASRMDLLKAKGIEYANELDLSDYLGTPPRSIGTG